MTKTILTSLFFIMTTILYSQKIKISVAPTINTGLYYRFVSGSPGQYPKTGFTTSIDYLCFNDKKINFGAGLDYHFSRVEFVPGVNSGDMLLHTENVSLISFRFRSVFKLKNQFYLSIDPSIDFHLKYDNQQTLDNQSGLGLSFGIGKNIKISESLFLNIEPKLWIHNIIPFTETNITRHLTALGINFGLVF
jgi:hypothetical protein